jgi:hypothetical protein
MRQFPSLRHGNIICCSLFVIDKMINLGKLNSYLIYEMLT